MSGDKSIFFRAEVSHGIPGEPWRSYTAYYGDASDDYTKSKSKRIGLVYQQAEGDPWVFVSLDGAESTGRGRVAAVMAANLNLEESMGAGDWWKEHLRAWVASDAPVRNLEDEEALYAAMVTFVEGSSSEDVEYYLDSGWDSAFADMRRKGLVEFLYEGIEGYLGMASLPPLGRRATNFPPPSTDHLRVLSGVDWVRMELSPPPLDVNTKVGWARTMATKFCRRIGLDPESGQGQSLISGMVTVLVSEGRKRRVSESEAGAPDDCDYCGGERFSALGEGSYKCLDCGSIASWEGDGWEWERGAGVVSSWLKADEYGLQDWETSRGDWDEGVAMRRVAMRRIVSMILRESVEDPTHWITSLGGIRRSAEYTFDGKFFVPSLGGGEGGYVEVDHPTIDKIEPHENADPENLRRANDDLRRRGVDLRESVVVNKAPTGHVLVRHEDGSWSILNANGTVVIEREGYTVAHGIFDDLLRGEATDPTSEIGDIVSGILGESPTKTVRGLSAVGSNEGSPSRMLAGSLLNESIKVGDRVRYNPEWARKAGQTPESLGEFIGTVVDVTDMIEVRWDDPIRGGTSFIGSDEDALLVVTDE
jgi:hypothetical protein